MDPYRGRWCLALQDPKLEMRPPTCERECESAPAQFEFATRRTLPSIPSIGLSNRAHRATPTPRARSIRRISEVVPHATTTSRHLPCRPAALPPFTFAFTLALSLAGTACAARRFPAVTISRMRIITRPPTRGHFPLVCFWPHHMDCLSHGTWASLSQSPSVTKSSPSTPSPIAKREFLLDPYAKLSIIACHPVANAHFRIYSGHVRSVRVLCRGWPQNYLPTSEAQGGPRWLSSSRLASLNSYHEIVQCESRVIPGSTSPARHFNVLFFWVPRGP